MADRGVPSGKQRAKRTPAPAPAPPEVPLPDDLPSTMFTGPGLMQLADLLPVMTAYADRDQVIRFMNKPYADWLGRPRREILGKTMRELIGEKNWRDRKPMSEAALNGERQFFAATYDHPERGLLALTIDYVPWVAPGGKSIEGICIVLNDVTEQRVAERALRESEERFRRI